MTVGLEPGRRDLAAAAERWEHARPGRWSPVPPELDRAIAGDRDLAAAALRAREPLLAEATRRLGGLVPHEAAGRYASALLAIPRERFVLPEDIAASSDDTPSPLDRDGLATVSAPHAYLLTYGLLELTGGDDLLELGSGTGYGAALASHIVGPSGRVTSIEIDPVLSERAARILAEPDARGPAPITLLGGDARTVAPDLMARPPEGPLRVAITYAIPSSPDEILALLPEGGCLVAPVGSGEDDQRLERWTREGGVLRRSIHGAVRYVAERR
jgi:protein-L-isoaspartate(D-aspartate) O-methyltransferase